MADSHAISCFQLPSAYRMGKNAGKEKMFTVTIASTSVGFCVHGLFLEENAFQQPMVVYVGKLMGIG